MTLPSTVTIRELRDQPVAVVEGRIPRDGIPGFLGHAFAAVMDAAAAQGRAVVGPPFARYGDRDDSGWTVEAGFPVDGPIRAEGDVAPTVLPGGPAAELVHTGPYETVAAGWEALSAWLAHTGSAPTGAPWECYLDEPGVAAPRTLIVMPCTPGTTGAGSDDVTASASRRSR